MEMICIRQFPCRLRAAHATGRPRFVIGLRWSPIWLPRAEDGHFLCRMQRKCGAAFGESAKIDQVSHMKKKKKNRHRAQRANQESEGTRRKSTDALWRRCLVIYRQGNCCSACHVGNRIWLSSLTTTQLASVAPFRRNLGPHKLSRKSAQATQQHRREPASVQVQREAARFCAYPARCSRRWSRTPRACSTAGCTGPQWCNCTILHH